MEAQEARQRVKDTIDSFLSYIPTIQLEDCFQKQTGEYSVLATHLKFLGMKDFPTDFAFRCYSHSCEPHRSPDLIRVRIDTGVFEPATMFLALAQAWRSSETSDCLMESLTYTNATGGMTLTIQF